MSWMLILVKLWTDNLAVVQSAYLHDKMCWIHGNALIFGFLSVIGILFIFNCSLCVMVMRSITWGRKEVSNYTKPSRLVLLLGAPGVTNYYLQIIRDNNIFVHLPGEINFATGFGKGIFHQICRCRLSARRDLGFCASFAILY